MAFAGGVLKVTPFAADAVAPHNSFDLFRLSMDLIAGNFAALHALGEVISRSQHHPSIYSLL